MKQIIAYKAMKKSDFWEKGDLFFMEYPKDSDSFNCFLTSKEYAYTNKGKTILLQAEAVEELEDTFKPIKRKTDSNATSANIKGDIVVMNQLENCPYYFLASSYIYNILGKKIPKRYDWSCSQCGNFNLKEVKKCRNCGKKYGGEKITLVE